MGNAAAVSATDWAEGMVEPLRQRAPEAEALRQLPEASVSEAEQAGFFNAMVPAEMGGQGGGLRELAEATRVLAHGCVPSAWTLSFLALHNWFLTRVSERTRAEVIGDRGVALMPCPLAPTGKGRLVEGGYQLTGRWEWSTGVQHANWAMVHGIVTGSDQFETRFFLVPIADISVNDVWHTAGMRGTGSNEMIIDDVFVPAHMAVLAQEFMSTSAQSLNGASSSVLQCPVMPALAMVASAPALGGAEAALDLFRERVSTRVLAYTLGEKAQEQPAAQIRLAEAKATVQAARLVWRDAVDRVVRSYEEGIELADSDLAEIRLAAAHTVALSNQAVTGILEASGASVHFEDSPLQQISRDLLTLRGHVIFDWDRTAQLAGKIDLGLPKLPTDLL